MSTSEPLFIFMLLKTTPEWLALPPADRFGFIGSTIGPILKRYPQVKLRFFDSEFYSARCTDVALWEAEDAAAWRHLVDDLRETAFWDRYFSVVELLPAVENGFISHYGDMARDALGQAMA